MNKYYLLFIVASLGAQLAHGMDNNNQRITLPSCADLLRSIGRAHEIVLQPQPRSNTIHQLTLQTVNNTTTREERMQFIENISLQNRAPQERIQVPREQIQMPQNPGPIVINNNVTNNYFGVTPRHGRQNFQTSALNLDLSQDAIQMIQQQWARQQRTLPENPTPMPKYNISENDQSKLVHHNIESYKKIHETETAKLQTAHARRVLAKKNTLNDNNQPSEK